MSAILISEEREGSSHNESAFRQVRRSLAADLQPQSCKFILLWDAACFLSSEPLPQARKSMPSGDAQAAPEPEQRVQLPAWGGAFRDISLLLIGSPSNGNSFFAFKAPAKAERA